MARGKEIEYKVCVYFGNSRTPQTLKKFRSYDKANKFLSEYLKRNPEVERAFIEKACSYFNNKRFQWK